MKSIPFLALALLLSWFGSAAAQTGDLTIRQLNHRAFSATDGAPTDIAALAQTPDGTLWIGGRTGLTRFDGMRFVPYPERGEEPLQQINVSALLAAPDGSLWIGFRPGGVALLKHGRVIRYGRREGLPDGAIQQFALDPDGSMWVAARLGVAHFEGGSWTQVGGEPELNTPYGVILDEASTLWVATVDGLRVRGVDEDRFREVDRRNYFGPRGFLMATAPDGRIWAAAGSELVRIPVDRAPTRVEAPLRVPGMAGGPLLFDAKGDLWAADTEGTALLRVTAEELTRVGRRDAIVRPQKFSRADGLSAGRVHALLEDRERNIWVATNTALHRFSQSTVVHDIVPPCSELGLQAPAFAAGAVGSLWIVCDDISEGHLREIRDGKVVSSHVTPPFSVAYRDYEGTVWLAGSTSVARIDGGRIVTEALMPENLHRPVQALLRDGGGGIWVSVTRRGTFHLVAGEWTENGNLPLPRDIAYVQVADETGALWFGYTENRIARLNGRQVQLFDAKQGLQVGNVLSMLAEDGELWVGGELGFARFDGKRFASIRNASGPPFDGVSGILRARDGDLWLNGTAGISHIERRELDQLLRDPAHAVQSESFNYLDGVPGTAVQLRPQPSAVETTDGRMWFSRTGGIVTIDPSQLARNTLPPPVTIWSVTSGAERYPNLGKGIRLPVHTTDLQIEYSAGSLTVPERVRFRYRLEGLDRTWHHVGNRREATYTNLGPGNYRFQVIAANNSGVWNDTGAAVAFAIPPAFYQTRWFYALCALLFVAMVAASYRVRVRQVAAQVRGRLEARLAERERIARELHDTLLQGMQGLIWRFHAAADRMPPGEPVRQLLEQSLDRADQLLGESRDKVKDLRPAAHDVADLAQALAAEGEQLAQLHQAKFRVSLQGTPRDLHPLVREEGFMIAREALTNAFRHAGAATIEAEVAYGDAALHIRVRDDGQGIDGTVLDAGGRPGHFGLMGMRERANKLGAHLEVWSKPGAGTEVELRVPANVAYRSSKAKKAEHRLDAARAR